MSRDKEVAISVKNITKSFKIPLDKGAGVKAKVLGRATRGYREFTPLQDISFDIYKGDFFGIVGRNGSGKSTLLKTIAGIYEPTAGRVEVNGTLVPFIELGVGFNPQLTGRENVYLNAALLGFSRAETDGMYEDIVDFAELHDFMEERLQNYSSGMQVRLAFSIAIRAKGDILLLDEVLAVGDTAFQQKCYDYFEQLKAEKKTVILVTHSMSNVERFCNRGLLLDNGRIKCIGDSSDVASAYVELFQSGSGKTKSSAGPDDDQPQSDQHQIAVDVVDGGEPTDSLKAGGKMTIRVTCSTKEALIDPDITVVLKSATAGTQLMSANLAALLGRRPAIVPGKISRYDVAVDNIYTNGDYTVLARLSAEVDGSRARLASAERSINIFGVTSHSYSLTHPKVEAKAVKDQGQK